MNQLLMQLNKEKEMLANLEKELSESIVKSIKGRLRLACRKGKPQYYYIGENEPTCNGSYIRKKDRELAIELAQREYDEALFSIVKRRLIAINNTIKEYNDENITDVFSKLNDYRKRMINSRIITDEEYISRWINQEYLGKQFFENATEIYTEAGVRVRSKSEKIIGDALEKRRIPYKYEYPIKLVNGMTVYPDFTVLNVRERKNVIWEHFGLMDDIEYVEKVIIKIEQYQSSGLKYGENLIFTFESRAHPLGSKSVIQSIEKYIM